MSVETQTKLETPLQPEAEVLNDSAAAETKLGRRFNPFIIGLIALVLLGVGAGWYLYSSHYEDTDGTIKAVHADDNQIVHAGDLLVELDPSEDAVAMQQTQAQFDQAAAMLGAVHPNLPITQANNRSDLASQQAAVVNSEAALASAQHDLDGAIARLKESQALNERNQADFARYQTLYDKQEVARADYDQYKATAAAESQAVLANQSAVASAQKMVEQRMAQLAQQHSNLQKTESNAPFQVAIQEADIKSQQASVEVAQAALEKNRLNLEYCRVKAPVSGVVTQRSAEVGARISRGQQLFMVVQTDDLWVTANFKETQLAQMHAGQHVRIHVDALGKDFDGTVESMPAVTGSRTSVLPPENATGNYVKVIQRLPVRIRFNSNQKDLDKLRPGMSVEPKVHLD
jgi:membrane fusion protein (multidrug efflux system)